MLILLFFNYVHKNDCIDRQDTTYNIVHNDYFLLKKLTNKI